MPETSNMKVPYPSSTDDPDIPADIQALAQALDTLLNVPDDVANFLNTTINIVTGANVWASLPTTPLTVTLTNPSAVFPLIVDVTLNTLMSSGTTSSQGFIGLAASGGVTIDPASPGGSGALAASENPRNQLGIYEQYFVEIPVIIPAGAAAVTFEMKAMRTTTTAFALNTPVLRAKPRRFKKP